MRQRIAGGCCVKLLFNLNMVLRFQSLQVAAVLFIGFRRGIDLCLDRLAKRLIIPFDDLSHLLEGVFKVRDIRNAVLIQTLHFFGFCLELPHLDAEFIQKRNDLLVLRRLLS